MSFICFTQNNTPQKVIEENPSRQSYFGDSGDIDGDYAVVTGVHSENPVAWNGGIAKIYKKNNSGIWEFTRAMYPKISSSEDRFGQGACAMEGNTVIVGDWMNVKHESGAAHIFKFWGDSAWKETAYLTPKNVAGVKNFGKSVDIYGNYAVVGANTSFYIFELQLDETWLQIKKISKPNAIGFGTKLAIHGDYLLVSSPYENVDGVEKSGAVYVYHNDNKLGWKYLEKIILSIEDTKVEAKFGSSIAIYKNNVLIGYPNAKMGEISAGNAYLYEIGKDEIKLKQKLFTKEFSFNKYRFGEQVSISENFIAIGEAQGKEHEGSVYIFEKINNEFKEVNRLTSGQKSYYGNDFGQNGLSLSNNNLFVGFPGDSHCDQNYEGCGSAFFYSLDKTTQDKEITPFVPHGLTKGDLNKKMKQFNADSIIFDDINGDDIYLLRASSNGLWGMYQSGKEIIPMNYEIINFYGWNDPFTFVKKNGNWCIYYGGFNGENHLTYCGYEELKKFTHKGYLYVAGKRNGKWDWVNWKTGNSTHMQKTYPQELLIYSNWNPGDYNGFK